MREVRIFVRSELRRKRVLRCHNIVLRRVSRPTEVAAMVVVVVVVATAAAAGLTRTHDFSSITIRL